MYFGRKEEVDSSKRGLVEKEIHAGPIGQQCVNLVDAGQGGQGGSES